MKGFPDLPPIWWLGSIGIIYLSKWAVPRWHWQADVLSAPSTAVFYAALALIAWAAIWFWQRKTPIEPHHTPKTLIVEGPYRVSRNPIYLGLVMLTFASALGHGSLPGLVATVALWWILDRRFARIEEKMLVATFGDAAVAYLARSRRWI
ncbi:MAG: isoprenylcysteine carboxylmethyltransferase family protein [Yoonia sp.]|nr:isoprenylcysteine carboxylmethyltransferase family protein [Yoonia sp.]